MQRDGSGVTSVWVWTCPMCGASVKRQRRLIGKDTPPTGAVLKAGYSADCMQERTLAVAGVMDV